MRTPRSTNRSLPARVAPWLVGLALLLRLLLPGLHHHHGPHPQRADPGGTPACSCGHVHAPEPTRDHDLLDAALVDAAHFCLACEVELGSPGAAAELPQPLPTAAHTTRLDLPHCGWSASFANDRRPPTRAPPGPSC